MKLYQKIAEFAANREEFEDSGPFGDIVLVTGRGTSRNRLTFHMSHRGSADHIIVIVRPDFLKAFTVEALTDDPKDLETEFARYLRQNV